ncbi:MAG: aldolase catalytic domain-containing protein [Planctomycetia bacterium]|nr:aldolase catalytic domain-containing protein [Planctomycetia bacterium]
MNEQWKIKNPKIKTLDCTIRDGGLVNSHRFSFEFVLALYRACADAKVDYIEIGYKNSDKIFAPDEFGDWKYCKEDVIRRIVDDAPEAKIKLSCMVDAGKSEWKTDVVPCAQSPLDMIRVAFYAHQVDEALAMIDDAWNKGYEVSANLMAVTALEEPILDSVLQRLSTSPASVFVIVDSFGAIIPSQAEYLTQKYLNYAQDSGKEVGMHAHNNLQLAFANTLKSIQCGATRVDATVGGLGRGAGNCPMELLLGAVNVEQYRIRPIYKLLQQEFIALRQQIEWGPFAEFMLTGQHNVHPKAAIDARKDLDTRDRVCDLFDQLEAQK